ncbi:MAG: sodium-dependent bicarbonate transport family permease [Planctomycetota bacterium]|nr:MAG: sodium-dependent bicarbonate transport family permease [Planctomycetota bacterium]
MLADFLDNFIHNLFKPLLLFFYMGFLIPILRVPFEFPHVLYQGLTMYLLISIGWHGGEELATLDAAAAQQALGYMAIGFFTNFAIGCLAYFILRNVTRLRNVDAATVAGYYGSDSAGTFVTCLGVLTAANMAYAAYMPVMLAIMEIPGCLVALFLVSRLREHGMDRLGNMPDEPDYNPNGSDEGEEGEHANGHAVVRRTDRPRRPIISPELLHEVFLNPGLYLLFGGILIGFVSRLQGHKVTDADDLLFVSLFPPMLCLFLLEMGITACKRLRDLRVAGWRFIAFAVLAPNVFATIGILITHLYSMFLGTPFDIGTYALFAVLCGAASYIAVPAVQRLAIPEASPTLPLAASLGLTFTYNVTIGIPVYILIATTVSEAFPVGIAT